MKGLPKMGYRCRLPDERFTQDGGTGIGSLVKCVPKMGVQVKAAR